MDADLLVKNVTDWWTANAPDWALQTVEYIRSIWNEGAYGLTYGEIATVTGILAFSLLIRGLFARTLVRWITRAASGTKTKIDDAIGPVHASLKSARGIDGRHPHQPVAEIPDAPD